MNSGHSRPSWNDNPVPDTAPTANRIAVPFDQRLQRSSQTGSPLRSQRSSATTIKSGIAIPTEANTM
jgi:hypothetical protein